MPDQTPDVHIFVSYRRTDTPLVSEGIYAYLAEHFGGPKRVFFDISTMEPGVPWRVAIDRALVKCDLFVLLIGSGWLSAADEQGNRRLDDPEDAHRGEIEEALELGIRIFPVLINDAAMPRREELPDSAEEGRATLKSLPDIHATQVRELALAFDMDRLAAALETAAPKAVEERDRRRKRLEALERARKEPRQPGEAAPEAPPEPPPQPPVEPAPPPTPPPSAQPGDWEVAEEIAGPRGTARGNNLGTRKQPGEPDHAGNAGGRSVWYRWTAPEDGTAAIDTSGSNFDTLLAVYRGPDLSNLQPVAANDDFEGSQSRVTFPAAAGAEYRIAVDGYGGQTGAIVLNWELQRPPPNASFGDAEELVGAGGSARGHNAQSHKEPGEPDHAGNPGGSSVWYRWRAPEDGVAAFDTIGSDFDTVLAVYRGSDVSQLDPVAANDDAAGLQSRVTCEITEGEEYRIAVDGYAGATGNIVLNWAVQTPPPNERFGDAEELPAASGTTHGGNEGAQREPGEPLHAGNAGGASVWYRWTAPEDGTATIDTIGSDFDTLLAVYTGSGVSQLQPIASNDDAEGRQSRVRFRASQGTEYRIAVDGYGGATGNIVLNWGISPSVPLADLMRDAGFLFTQQPDGTLMVPFPGQQAKEVVVNAREMGDGMVIFFVVLPEFSGFGKGTFLKVMLQISHSADYAKAVHLTEDRYAFTIEAEASVLTPPICQGLVSGLAALSDVKDQAGLLGDARQRLENCGRLQDLHISVDPAAARAEAEASLAASPLGPQVSIYASGRVVSLMRTLEGVKPRGKKRLLPLLELNRQADVAKVGLDSHGQVVLLYEVPQVTPGLADRAAVQFAILEGQVRAIVD